MKGIIAGIKTLIDVIKMIFSIIMSIFKTLGMVLRYLLTIVELAFDSILLLPEWLKAFAVVTISISIAYFLIGRSGGKSEWMT